MRNAVHIDDVVDAFATEIIGLKCMRESRNYLDSELPLYLKITNMQEAISN